MAPKPKPPPAPALPPAMLAAADREVDAGIAAQNADRPLDAITAYQKALTYNPMSLDAHMNLGVVLSQLGRPKTATDHLQQALSLAPHIPQLSLNAARSLALVGRRDLALTAVERVCLVTLETRKRSHC